MGDESDKILTASKKYWEGIKKKKASKKHIARNKIVWNLRGEVKTSAPWGIKKYYSRSTNQADVVETPLSTFQDAHLLGLRSEALSNLKD